MVAAAIERTSLVLDERQRPHSPTSVAGSWRGAEIESWQTRPAPKRLWLYFTLMLTFLLDAPTKLATPLNHKMVREYRE